MLTAIPKHLYHFTGSMEWAAIKHDRQLRRTLDPGTQRMGVYTVEAENFQSRWPETPFLWRLQQHLTQKTCLSPGAIVNEPVSIVALEVTLPPELPFVIRVLSQVEKNKYDLGSYHMDGFTWRQWQMEGRDFFNSAVEFKIDADIPLNNVRPISQFSPQPNLFWPDILRGFILAPQEAER